MIAFLILSALLLGVACYGIWRFTEVDCMHGQNSDDVLFAIRLGKFRVIHEPGGQKILEPIREEEWVKKIWVQAQPGNSGGQARENSARPSDVKRCS